MCAVQLHRRHRNTVTARAPGGHRLKFDPCSGMKVLGSWCDDSGDSTGALVASLQTGNSASYKYKALLKDRKLPIVGRTKAFGTACVDFTLHGSETLHLDSANLKMLKGWEGRCIKTRRRSRRGNWETHQHQRTEDAVDGTCTKNEILRIHFKALLRLHKWARAALNLQWTAEECFTLKAPLLYRDHEWWKRTQADVGLRKRNCEATRKYRHGTNVPVRRCEAPFVEVFGVNWKQTSMAEDGTHWHELRWVFCLHNTQKLQNPPHVAAREGKGARAKGRTTGERGKTAEATHKQREGGRRK